MGEKGKVKQMTAETSNLILAVVAVLGVVLAIFGAIGNVIAFLFARLELKAQRRETRELQKLTNDLQRELQRLYVERDQNIHRLHRAREALLSFHASMASMIVLAHFETSQFYKVDTESLANLLGNMTARFSEFAGLVVAINDKDLLQLLREMYDLEDTLRKLVDLRSDEVIDQRDEYEYTIGKAHARISELIADATKEKK
ncbi:MAG: hypothetical protein K8J31_25805 [Anaerolineae bacterium]|nr:hypothetical protein [Anaerolineae bacterium]